ncbi:MAG TPA: DUF177 domain-containing protein [Geminicoccaceae bacterium]
MPTTATTTPEFSRPCAVERLPAGGMAFDLEASPAERAALARRFDLAGLDRLTAKGRVELAPGGLLEVRGRLQAELSQRCVVTLEPVPASVDTEFRRLFTREALPPDAVGGVEVEIDLDADVPEPLLGEDGLDLGEVAAEEMAVALDPYPRSPNADAVLAEVAARAAEEDRGPFAVLAPLHRGGGGSGSSGDGPH